MAPGAERPEHQAMADDPLYGKRFHHAGAAPRGRPTLLEIGCSGLTVLELFYKQLGMHGIVY